MAGIFISYRRDDSAAFCGRMYDRLTERFGKEAVFKDVDSIPPGVEFAGYIQSVLRQCAVQLVVIGPHWLDTRAYDGSRRLDDPRDLVRLEIEAGLALGIVVIPVIAQGAPIPEPQSLPPSLQPLITRNAPQVRNDPDFNTDMDRLVKNLTRWVAPLVSYADTGAAPKKRSRVAAPACAITALVVLIAVVGVGVLLAHDVGNIFSGISANLGANSGGSNADTQAIQQIYGAFCTSLHQHDNATAYTYLSHAFQSQVGSAANLPAAVGGGSATYPNKATGCEAMSPSSLFPITVTGTSANVTLQVDFTNAAGASTEQRVFEFIKVGSTWEIDNIHF